MGCGDKEGDSGDVGAAGGDACSGVVSSGTIDPCGEGQTFDCECELTYDSCSSGDTYRVECINDNDGGMDCECFLNSVSVGSFQADALCEFDTPDGEEWEGTVNTGCGFDISH